MGQISEFSKRKTTLLGVMAICFYIIHGAYWIFLGVPSNLLWACHIGSLAVGFGLIGQRPLLNSIGVLWLGLGNIIWYIYLIGGGSFEWTSPLTHVGGIIIGIIGLFKMGIPKKSWIWALMWLAVLQHLSRWITPEKENINLAFRVHEGWESVFPSYAIYLISLFLIAGIVFFTLEKLFGKLVNRHTYNNLPSKAEAETSEPIKTQP